MQCALPDEDHEVPGHGMQDEFDEEPEALLYVSSGHMLHTVLPDTSEYVPAPHEMHSVLADALGACIVTVADRYDPSLQG